MFSLPMYSLQFFQDYIKQNGIPNLPIEVKEILDTLEKSLNIPETPPPYPHSSHSHHHNDFKDFKDVTKRKNKKEEYKKDFKYSKDSNKDFNKDSKKNFNFSKDFDKDSKDSKDSNKDLNIKDIKDKWIKVCETEEKFKPTNIEKKQGIEKTMNDIRVSLNKISKKNFENQTKIIFDLIEQIMSKENTNEELIQNISKFIFDIASSNQFFCELYADLYKLLIDKYDFFNDVLQHFVSNFKESMQTFCYCDPNTDYEKYCAFTKESSRKKATTAFIVMLLNRGVVLKETLMDIILHFQQIILTYIDEPNRSNEAEELGDILHILISLKKPSFDETDEETVLKNIRFIAGMKVKEHPSLTSRLLFKMQETGK